MTMFLLMMPLLLIVLIGYCSARFSFLSEDSNTHFTRFAFFIAIPCLLFSDFSKMPISQSIHIPYILDFALCVLIVGTAVFIVSKYVFKKSLSESVLNVMGSSMVNTAYFAIPLFLLVFNNPAPVLPILIFQAVILTAIILLTIEYDVGEKSTQKRRYYLQTLKNIVLVTIKNPVIVACIAGVGCSFFKWHVPVVMDHFLKLIGATAAPLVLFALGQSLFFDVRKMVGKEVVEVLFLVFIKLLILPTLAFFVGKYVIHLNHFWFASLVVMAAMPSPKNMFIFAVRYQLDVKKASAVIALSTLLSFITLDALLILFHAYIRFG